MTHSFRPAGLAGDATLPLARIVAKGNLVTHVLDIENRSEQSAKHPGSEELER